VAVLQIDLQGSGDSEGDFADARWEHWKDDAAAAVAWLQARSGRPPGLWGLRLGALLALDVARTVPVARLLLWQPVLNGASFMTQFLRLRVAGGMLDAEQAGGGTKELRAHLQTGEALEVAGYMLAPQLAASIDALDAGLMAPACPTDWIELVATAERPIPPAAQRVASVWTPPAQLHKIAGPAFWSTQEISESAELLAATCALFEGASHG
jgi:exosortase A-associated hydrolase 2